MGDAYSANIGFDVITHGGSGYVTDRIAITDNSNILKKNKAPVPAERRSELKHVFALTKPEGAWKM